MRGTFPELQTGALRRSASGSGRGIHATLRTNIHSECQFVRIVHGSGSGSAGAMRAGHEAPEGSGRMFERQRMEIRKKRLHRMTGD